MTNHIPEHDAPDDERIIDCASCQDNIEELALGILPASLMAPMTRHFEECPACRAEYRRTLRVTRMLPFLADPEDPSPEVKTLLMKRIDRAEREDATPPVMLHNPWTEHEETESKEAAPSATGASWTRWIMPGLIAPLAICLIVLSAWANSLRNEVQDLRESDNAEIASVSGQSASPYDLQLYDFKPACENCPQNQASGQFGGNPNGNVGVVVAWNLDPDETHQVWCINHQGERQLITNLDVEFTGSVLQTVNFPEAIGGYQQIYVARHDGSADPDAELLVAVNDQQQTDPPASTPQRNNDD